MIVPRFLRFYGGYTAQSVLNEYAVSFFSLVNSMFRLQAQELLDSITANTVASHGGQEAQAILKNLQQKTEGLHGIVQEVRNIKP